MMEAVMSKTQAATLSDSQLVILSAAAQRAEGSLLPFPQSLTAKGTALHKVVGTLCNRKLAEERRTINGAPEWRRDEDDRPLGVFITNSGLLALGVDNAQKDRPSQARRACPASARRQPHDRAAKLARHPRSSPSSRQRLGRANRIW